MVGDGDTLELLPLDVDTSPAVIGTGWLSAVRDEHLRIKTPMIRKGWLENRNTGNRCDDIFVAVDWDTALDLAAEELKRVCDESGNEAIYAGSYGWASAGRFHHAQSQLKRFLNCIGGYVGSKDTYSHAASEVLTPLITGMSHREFQDQSTTWQGIARECELLVCFGGISPRTAQICSGGTTMHELPYWLDRCRDNNMNLVNVSPQKSDLLISDETQWFSIRPNTDTALMMGIAHWLVENNAHDTQFLEKYTNGWAEFKRYLLGLDDNLPKSPAWAAQICDVAVRDIEQLAQKMAERKTLITVAWSLQRADHGEQPIWMGLVLAAMLGQIGQPGLGYGFGYGSTAPVGRPHKLIKWPSLPQGQNPVQDFIPVARIADMLLSPGAAYQYNGQHRQYPAIKLVYWAGGNPFHHHQDLFRLEQAWKNPETVIVNDMWWNATTRRADIIFPVTSPLERQDLMINPKDPSLIFMDKLFEPMGEARNDYDVFSGLAKRFGVTNSFTEGRTEEQWLQKIWEESIKRSAKHGISLPEYETFKRIGRFTCPDSDEERASLQPFISDPENRKLNTHSGRIEIVSETIRSFTLDDCPAHPVWYEPTEWLGSKSATDMHFHLISGQPLNRLHAQLDNGDTSRNHKINDREPIYLHRDVAAKYGIKDNDLILVSSTRGHCLTGAVLSENIRKDTVAIATGSWMDRQRINGLDIDVHGNPNVLTLDKGCSTLSQGPSAHTTLVSIQKWMHPAPLISAFDPPVIESRIQIPSATEGLIPKAT